MDHPIDDQDTKAGISAHGVDVHIGARVRALRRTLALSQIELGERIGVSFQQVQKYETAKSRVSAAMLLSLARALRTSPGAFYEGLETPAPRPVLRGVQGLDYAA